MVTVWPTPSGLPTASTRSPTRIADESPIATTGRLAASILMTARSLGSSAPISFASSTRRSDSSTWMRDDSSTTWLLVRMYPSPLRITPDPSPRCNGGGTGRPRRCPRWPNRSPKGKPSGTCGNCVNCGDALRSVRIVTTPGVTFDTTSAKPCVTMRPWPVAGVTVSGAAMAAWAVGLAGRPVQAPRLAAPRASRTAPTLNCERDIAPSCFILMSSKTSEGLAEALPADYIGVRKEGA